MDCVRCDGSMAWETYEGIAIDRCERCAGVWLDRRELLPILEKREVEFGPGERAALRAAEEAFLDPAENLGPDGLLRCPKCEKQMEKSRYPYALSILVDRCPAGCGVWLDRGELELVQIAVEGSQDEVEAYMAEHGDACRERWDRWNRELDEVRREGRSQYWKTQRDFVHGLASKVLRR